MNIEIGLSDLIVGTILGISLTICAQVGFIRLRQKLENWGDPKVVSVGTIGN